MVLLPGDDAVLKEKKMCGSRKTRTPIKHESSSLSNPLKLESEVSVNCSNR